MPARRPQLKIVAEAFAAMFTATSVIADKNKKTLNGRFHRYGKN
jgi:hypothetical protein